MEWNVLHLPSSFAHLRLPPPPPPPLITSSLPLARLLLLPRPGCRQSLLSSKRKCGSVIAAARCRADGHNPTETKAAFLPPRQFRDHSSNTPSPFHPIPLSQVPFGYTRKDVLLIGLGVTVFGFGLKYCLERFGLDPPKAGNVVQVLLVLGLTMGWISTYIFRVSTKEMTYAKQLRDYETEVMKKRLEELPETELEYMLAQVEEEKRRLRLRQNQVPE